MEHHQPNKGTRYENIKSQDTKQLYTFQQHEESFVNEFFLYGYLYYCSPLFWMHESTNKKKKRGFMQTPHKLKTSRFMNKLTHLLQKTFSIQQLGLKLLVNFFIILQGFV